MLLGLGLPPCTSTLDASSTSCIVVPCVTRGTLCQEDTPPSTVWFGQVVDTSPAVVQAYQSNHQAAVRAGAPVVSEAEYRVEEVVGEGDLVDRQVVSGGGGSGGAGGADNSLVLGLGLAALVALALMVK